MTNIERYHQILRRPVITERATAMTEKDHKVTFEVDVKANKVEIAHAVQTIYGVTVVDVTTAIIRGKIKRVGKHLGKRSNWKRAIVTLKEGETIDFYANV